MTFWPSKDINESPPKTISTPSEAMGKHFFLELIVQESSSISQENDHFRWLGNNQVGQLHE